MHWWLSVRFARTARVHDDSRQFAANRSKNLHRFGSVLSGIRTGAVRFGNDRSAYRSVRGSLSGKLSAGAIQPALPQEAPAATPVRSTTVTETPRSCRNHAVDSPTMPAPTTIADRGPVRLSPTPTVSMVDQAQATSGAAPDARRSASVVCAATRVSGASIQPTAAASRMTPLIVNAQLKLRCWAI